MNRALNVDRMSLQELQEEKRSISERLRANDGLEASLSDAKRFKQICDAIRYIKEMKDWATKMNAGKASEAMVSLNSTPLFQSKKAKEQFRNSIPLDGYESKG